MTKLISFFKANTVFCLAAFLAFVTAFYVPPSMEYISYIDFRVLGLLFSLMTVVAGLQKAGIFAMITVRLFRFLKTVRQMAGVMIFACFFASMWITNDVSLITFVPFALVAFHEAGEEKELIKLVVLQTIAANLGSMCTPVGNPQNLYLYLVSGMGAFSFVSLLLPYTVISFILLCLSLFWFPGRPVKALNGGLVRWPVHQLFLYGFLFLSCMLTVGNIVDWRLTAGLVLGAVLFFDRPVLKRVDYILLLTFAAFFIFIGNLKHIDFIYTFLTAHTEGHEFLVSLLASQVISNVPAAILLSGFTENFEGLMLGTDIGGLGTMIASMASLISYKIYTVRLGQAGQFLFTFTWVNVVFLIILVGCYAVIGK
ncbi:SLC13 family permease [Dialister sp.]|uniref:SLC13 family permease n=1 Tax=Dialister sp. TaxID=1955814 RepID=UPI002E7FE868|nr:SLC13 family permease [Dialister sp.]MEE3452943.1 SLC13 family permease [Dialister sp.]